MEAPHTTAHAIRWRVVSKWVLTFHTPWLFCTTVFASPASVSTVLVTGIPRACSHTCSRTQTTFAVASRPTGLEIEFGQELKIVKCFMEHAEIDAPLISGH